MNIVMCFSSKLEEIFIHKRKGRRELSIIKQMQICREDNTSKVIMCASFTNIPVHSYMVGSLNVSENLIPSFY